MSDIIEIVPYDVNWPKYYEAEAKEIKQSLGDKCISIYHIGSTSIPGCDAKPIIDILLVIPSLNMHDQIAPILKTLGYIDRSDYAFFMRLFFKKSNIFNVHVFENEDHQIDRFLKFRNWMCQHPYDLNKYMELKKLSAQKYPNSFDQYCNDKEKFVTDIEEKAGYKKARIVRPYTHEELKFVEQLKKIHSSELIFKSKANTKNAPSDSHFDLIAYKGSKLIGYISIQFIEDDKAFIKLIPLDKYSFTDEIHGQIITDCKNWLYTHGVNKFELQGDAVE